MAQYTTKTALQFLFSETAPSMVVEKRPEGYQFLEREHRSKK